MTKYEGPSLRWSNRQYTLARKLSHTAISGQAIKDYDMRTLVPMIKSGDVIGSMKTKWFLSDQGYEKLHAFGHTVIERKNTAYIPEFVQTFHSAQKVLSMRAQIA
jgi:hypothetical protein